MHKNLIKMVWIKIINFKVAIKRLKTCSNQYRVENKCLHKLKKVLEYKKAKFLETSMIKIKMKIFLWSSNSCKLCASKYKAINLFLITTMDSGEWLSYSIEVFLSNITNQISQTKLKELRKKYLDSMGSRREILTK